jgi:thioredoxin reductase (NADPH)
MTGQKRTLLVGIVIGIVVIIIAGIFLFRNKIRLSLFSKKVYVASQLKELEKLQNVVELAVIGSGPAGLSAALYGARGKLHTVVFQGSKPGGQLTGTSWVENWPGLPKTLGIDLIKGLREQAQAFGALIINQTIVRVDFSQWPFTLWTDEGVAIKALAVVIATGANPKKLECPGEEEFWGRGVTTCAICDAPFYKDSDVVVVGGGDSAAEEAMQLAPYAKTIKILVRSNIMRASGQMQDRLKEYNNIEVIYNASIRAIKGDDQHVHSLEVMSQGKQETWPIDGVFLAIGHTPNTQLFTQHVNLKMNNGYIIVEDRSQKTSIPGVFAAGDVADDHYRQAGVAAGDGIKAALDAAEFLRTQGISETIMTKLQPLLFNVVKNEKRKELPLIGSDEDFQKEVVQSSVPVVVDFYTQYCPSCLQMLPALESAAHDLSERVNVVKVDALASRDLTNKLVVPTVPTLLIFKQGHEVARTTMIMQKKEIIEFVQKYL